MAFGIIVLCQTFVGVPTLDSFGTRSKSVGTPTFRSKLDSQFPFWFWDEL